MSLNGSIRGLGLFAAALLLLAACSSSRPAARGTAQGPPSRRMLADAGTSVTVASCPDGRTGYNGGILLREPTCVVLRVQGDHQQPARAVTVPIAVPHC